METYVVFLRGINLGARNRITMPRAAELLTTLELTDVAWRGATGNFRASLAIATDPEELALAVEDLLAQERLLRVHAVVQPADRVRTLVAAQHFAGRDPVQQRWCATFLRRPPAKDPLQRLLARGYDVVLCDETVVLTAYDRSMPRMDGVNTLIESSTGVAATTRWWNVVADFATML